jgi:hypothetical protein
MLVNLIYGFLTIGANPFTFLLYMVNLHATYCQVYSSADGTSNLQTVHIFRFQAAVCDVLNLLQPVACKFAIASGQHTAKQLVL